MKRLLKNWKLKLTKPEILNSSKLCYSDIGGNREYYIVIGLLYLLVYLYNFIQIFFRGDGVIYIIGYSLPFLLFSILLFSKYKEKSDIFIDLILCLIIISFANTGEFSGFVFILLILFRIDNKKLSYILISSIIIAITINSIVINRSILSTFLILFLYLFLGFKSYNIIIKPFQELKSLLHFKDSVIDSITNKLEILGTPEYLSDSQIISKYGFLKYTGQNGDNPYRKLKDLRKLSEGHSNKSIGAENGVTELHQSKMFKIIKESLEPYNADEQILNNTHLIKLCIELGIIRVIIRV